MIKKYFYQFLFKSKSILEVVKQKITFKKLAVILLSISLFGFISLAILILLVMNGSFGAIPTKDELSKIENPIASEIYSADSVLLGKFFIQERTDISFKQIPKHVIDALLTTEDVRFYEHHGIDYRSLSRVLIKSILLQAESSGGGSTLTQQLAKNLYPRKSYWVSSLLINKIREMVIASRLESIFSKQTIITLYLNTVAFSDNTYGIETASYRFFSKATQNLTVEEAAVLIGMLKATHTYNPKVFPEKSRKRRNVVLSQMNKYGKLSATQFDSLRKAPLLLSYKRINHNEGLAPYFREYIRQELLVWCTEHKNENGEPYNLYVDGLKIYTTIDSQLQYYAEKSMAENIAYLQNIFNKQWKNSEPWINNPEILNDAIRKSPQYNALQNSGLSHQEIIQRFSEKKPMKLFSWEDNEETFKSTLDSIKHYLKIVNAGFVGMEPHTGAIRAWVGGIDHRYFQYDHVKMSTKRQVGSIIKPIVYAAALEHGQKPCTFISAEKTTYEDSVNNSSNWSPSNTDDNYHLKYSMEGALAFSVNTVAIHALEATGIKPTILLARKMGIQSEMEEVPSLALGTPSISLTEMVTAYSCFVNKGVSVKPFYLTSIATHSGKPLETFITSQGEKALSEENALMMIHMLKRTVNEGTAVSLRNNYNLENDIAGKTGTTQQYADGWFLAMTPNLVVGAWVGADNPGIRFKGSMGQGAKTALPIVGKFFKYVNSNPKLESISKAKFEKLPISLERKLNCELYKKDLNLVEKLFGKDKRDSKRKFGEKKKNTFKDKLKKLFSL